MENVPNFQTFRIVLVCVKKWASINGIYSNSLGFLGGVNFALMVAWCCKRYPKHQPYAILRIFFRTFATWSWPSPVMCCPIQETPPTGVAKMPAWNPRNPSSRDASHIMPIVSLSPRYFYSLKESMVNDVSTFDALLHFASMKNADHTCVPQHEFFL
mmetsp:Transcript_20768/g.33462  ORF Transcript_20768/g.33462 Transcript_20768/m.33462 type:complete len:157 (-) Transcript_20768:893-1363(-)